MLNTILHNFKDAVTQAVIHSGFGSEDTAIVHFIDPSSEGETLKSEAINIALFGSTAEKDLLGTSNYGMSNTGSDTGIQQKPNLKLSLDVVLIFNFQKYDLSLECYGQVLGYFYNNDTILSTFDGFDNQIEVVLSGFNDRNEIEIWNSFNSPGIPLLRYDLRYAIISGSMQQLPAIKEISTKADTTGSSSVDNLILNLIYNPAEKELAKVVNATTAFASVNLNAEDSAADITERYSELIESYDVAKSGIENLSTKLSADLPQYIPALNGLAQLIESYKNDLASAVAPNKDNFKESSAFAQSKVRGAKGMSSVYMQSLNTTAETIKIVTGIEAQIQAFNFLGESIYKHENDSFKERDGLSVLQLRKKWWELETVMYKVNTEYSKGVSNELLDVDGDSFVAFKKRMNECQAQLKRSLEPFEKLNKEYSSEGLVELSSEIKEKYLNAYINCFTAINYINNESVIENLSQDLQSVLIEQNK